MAQYRISGKYKLVNVNTTQAIKLNVNTVIPMLSRCPSKLSKVNRRGRKTQLQTMDIKIHFFFFFFEIH